MSRLSQTLCKEKVAGYVFIMPFIIGLLVFTVIPFFTSLYLAFTDYNILTPPKWVGLDNFRRMFFEDKYFWKSFFVTFKFALVQVPIKLLVSLGVSTKLRGYSYLREAVLYMADNPMASVTKELYPAVARRFGCSGSQVVPDLPIGCPGHRAPAQQFQLHLLPGGPDMPGSNGVQAAEVTLALFIYVHLRNVFVKK